MPPLTLRLTHASMTTATPKPSITRSVDDEPNHLAREWLAVGHRFAVACTRQGGPQVDNGHSVADGSPPSALALGADAVGSVEGDGPFRHVCMCEWISRCALQ